MTNQNQAQPSSSSSNVVGIHQRAMLVTAIFRYKGWTKADPDFAGIIAAQTGANPNRVGGSKRLIESDFPELAELRKIKNDAYKHHKENTLPWDNWSKRLLTSDSYQEYTKAQRAFKSAYEVARDKLKARMADLKADARANLGTAYRDEDFADLDRVDELYVIDHDFEPLPQSDFRVGLTQAEKDKLRAEAERRLQERVNNAVADTWARLESKLALLTERLQQYDAKDRETRAKWDSAWLDGVRAVVDMIPSLNFTDDPKLEEVAVTARKTILRFEQDELRADPAARAEAVQSAEAVMDKMQSFFGGPKAA
jgi:hypothetical protein